MSPVLAVREAASRPSTAAILHGVSAVLMGLVLMIEPPGGYHVRVYDGPKAILGGGDAALAGWGLLFVAGGAVILALRGGRPSRWALMIVAGVWATFGGGALGIGITAPDAASVGGLAWLIIAAGCVRAGLEFDRPLVVG